MVKEKSILLILVIGMIVGIIGSIYFYFNPLLDSNMNYLVAWTMGGNTFVFFSYVIQEIKERKKNKDDK